MIHLRQSVFLVALAVAIAVSAAACHKDVPMTAAAPPPSTPPPTVTPPPPAPPPAPAPTPPPAAAPALTEDQLFARKTLEQLNVERPLGDVYFDLDKSEVRDDARPLLQKNADWMKRWTATQVTVEGHCDARGSAEYNLALGTKRANAVKDYLVNLGVPANRVTVISKGKEQPICNEDTDPCWQQNRRGHFVITAK